MTEAMWVALIGALPSLMWVLVAIMALGLAGRILTRQSHRINKVETPFVSIGFAEAAIEEARRLNRPALSSSDGQSPPALRPPPDWVVPVGPPEPVPASDADAEPAPASPPPDPRPAPSPWTEPPSAPRPPNRPSTSPGARRPRTRPGSGGPATPPDSTGTGTEDPQSPPSKPAEEPSDTVPPLYPYPQMPDGPGTYPRFSPPIYGHTNATIPPYARMDGANRAERSALAAKRLARSADLLQGGTILWVDDHPESNVPLVRLFRSAGIRVDDVVRTEEALKLMRSASYDLVITDMERDTEVPPESAGLTLLDEMVKRGVPMPAIIYSDDAAARTAVHPRVVVCTDEPEVLVDNVVDVLERRPRGGGGSLLRRG